MIKAPKRLLATAALLACGTALTTAPAYAFDDASKITEAANGLKTYQVFKSASATITDGKTLASKIKRADVGVAIVSASEIDSKNPNDFAAAVRNEMGSKYSTVIVAVDGPRDTFGVSSAKPEVQSKISSYLGSEPVNDAAWTLIKNSDNLINVESAVAADMKVADENAKAEADRLKNEANKPARDAAIKTWLIGFTSLIILYFSGRFIGNLISKVRKNRSERVSEKKDNHKFKNAGSEMREVIKDFKNVAMTHGKLGNQSLKTMSLELVDTFAQLERVMNESDLSVGRKALIEAEYINRLPKLTDAIGEDYYISMVENPHHWNDAYKKKDRVINAITAMETQVLDTIRQIKSASELEFTIGLDQIIGDKNVSFEDLYSENPVKEPVSNKKAGKTWNIKVGKMRMDNISIESPKFTQEVNKLRKNNKHNCSNHKGWDNDDYTSPPCNH